ncbi:hypothetical protein PsorP6_007432 [Peronosclerospora sorghi]|uniref:Uncharacterized protein n=1 Tax=Peronosclerospora sorghi TaxID=230839 RepID=A0ACC0W9W7_9STRA|nr:hypothetical protein PsorP6_007432 [Peronosclerospora sorghi]
MGEAYVPLSNIDLSPSDDAKMDELRRRYNGTKFPDSEAGQSLATKPYEYARSQVEHPQPMIGGFRRCYVPSPVSLRGSTYGYCLRLRRA